MSIRLGFPRTSSALLLAWGLILFHPAAASAANLSGSVEVRDKGGARSDGAQVVVWLDGAGLAAVPPKKPEKTTFQMTSKDKRFTPPVLVIAVGTEVTFPNVDPIYHNVFSVSGENRFDLGLYKSGASKAVTFKKAGLVRVYCNIHSQMVGFIHVLPSTFSAVTKGDGAFEIRGVPPGKYTLKVWEEKAGESSRPVTVTEGGAPIKVEVDAGGFTPKPHLNKFGKTYPPAGADDERY